MRGLAVSFVTLILLASAPALAADPADLAEMVDAKCAACHGPGAKGDSDEAVAMKAPDVTGQDAGAIVASVRGNPAHKSLSPGLNDADLNAIAGYLAAD